MRASLGRSGFTMIELLMTLVIISVLAVAALPQLLDMRREAKVALLQELVAAMRVGLKNQNLQVKLRCTVPTGVNTLSQYNAALGYHLLYNDITVAPSNNLCSTSEIINPQDRRFYDISGQDLAHTFITGGVDIGTEGYSVPANPFARPELIATGRVQILRTININGTPATPDQICNFVDAEIAYGHLVHWVYDSADGTLHPGTNTPGIRECAI